MDEHAQVQISSPNRCVQDIIMTAVIGNIVTYHILLASKLVVLHEFVRPAPKAVSI